MAYSIQVHRFENKSKHEQSGDHNFFDNADQLEPFTGNQIQQLRARLASNGFKETSSHAMGSEFIHPANGVSALLTGEGLYFRAALNQDSIFDASMIASELTDTGEFAKFDPQAGGWEEV